MDGDEGVTPEVEQSDGSEQQTAVSPDVERLTKALERERQARKDAERAAKDGKSAAQRLAELEERSKTDSERAVEQARREAAAEAEARVAERFTGLLLRSTVLARATASFEDPEDALTVDLDGLSVNDDGSVDTDEVDRRLADLLSRKPHWKKAGARFGDVGAGPRDVAEPIPTDPMARIAFGLRNSSKAGKR